MSVNLFELSVKPQSGSVQHYLLAVPQALRQPVAEYLREAGCKFTGRFSIKRGNRAEFHIESAPAQVIERLVERTRANNGLVQLALN